MIEHGTAKTPFMKYGDQVRIEMFDEAGRSIFGAIEQTVAPQLVNERRSETA
jgi:fumarylacetoacetate (FAA) hydrolase